jgi:hypothetical protein
VKIKSKEIVNIEEGVRGIKSDCIKISEFQRVYETQQVYTNTLTYFIDFNIVGVHHDLVLVVKALEVRA